MNGFISDFNNLVESHANHSYAHTRKLQSFWIDPPTVSLGAPGQSVGVVHAGLYRVCYPKNLADQNDVTTNVTIAGPLDAALRDFREGFLALTPGRSGEFGDVPGAYERCTVAVKTHFYSNVYGENYWPRVQAVQVFAPAFVLLGLLKLVLMYVVNGPGMNDWPPFGVALVQVACGIAVVSVFGTIYSDVVASAPQGPVVVFTGEQENDVVVTSAPHQSVTQLWGWSFWTFASAVLSELLGALMMMC